MNKIILKSLELAGFKNASEIAHVIAATPNPQVAAEIVLGIHEPLMICEFGQCWKRSYYDDLYEVVSIDELHSLVTCKKYSQKVEYFSYLSKEDFDNRVNGVARADRQEGVKYYDSRNEKVTGYNTNIEIFKLEQFNESLKPIETYMLDETLISWNPPLPVELLDVPTEIDSWLR